MTAVSGRAEPDSAVRHRDLSKCTGFMKSVHKRKTKERSSFERKGACLKAV